MRPFAVLATIVVLAGGAEAQTGPRGGRTEPAPAPVSTGPQQTTATFGDWTLRCVRPAAAAKSCELVQVAQRDGKPVAEMAIGSMAKGLKLQFTILVPTSVSFGVAPAVSPASGEGVGLTLSWRRCLPGGCIADGEIGDEALTRMRGWSQAGSLSFMDGVGHTVTVPVSPVGLTPALEALAKEDAG